MPRRSIPPSGNREEIRLHRAHVELLGCLPQYQTGTGFDITPVVGLVTPPFELQLDPFEVAEVFEVPLSFLLDESNLRQRHSAMIREVRREYYAMPYGEYFIWGATAGMLVSRKRFVCPLSPGRLCWVRLMVS